MTMLTGLYPACGLHIVVTQSMGSPGLVNPIWSRYHRPPGPSAWLIFSRSLDDFLLLGSEFAPERPRVQFKPRPEGIAGVELEEIAWIGRAAFAHSGLSHGESFDAALHLCLRMIRQECGCGPLLRIESRDRRPA